MMRMEDSNDLEILRRHAQNLRERLVEKRKLGLDTKIVEIKMMNLMPKIAIAEITRQQNDAEAVMRIVAEVEDEIRDLRQGEDFEGMLRHAAEDEHHRLEEQSRRVEYIKLNQLEIVSKTQMLINQANEYLDNKEFGKVYPIYIEIQGIYKYLPAELKKAVYFEAINIYNRLEGSGIFKVRSRWQIFLSKIMRVFHK